MKTAIVQALLMYALAGAISMMVALMIKGLFLLVRKLSSKGSS